jgi:hypothetical protein
MTVYAIITAIIKLQAVAPALTGELTIFLKFIGAGIVGITLWYKDVVGVKLGIKKGDNDVQTGALENIQKNLDIYQEMVTDIDVRYKAKIKDLEDSFQHSLEILQEEVAKLQSMNKELGKIIKKQEKEINSYKSKYGELNNKGKF